MKARWKRHKPDCENICTARNAFPNAQLLPGEVMTTVMTHWTSLTLERIAVLEGKGHAAYDSYGVDSLPAKRSPMSKPKKLALYVDVLDAYCSNSKENKDLPLVERYLLNSLHNNVYHHGKEHLEPEEWVDLHVLMKIFQVGAFQE
ncbi:hypothetical protein Poli38472_008826 [Pythium oligandrum]|uniref:Uncharacterized protein n=1 Tax=Pythium oligandrum TaxID=41045 RepID=A0A8K1C4B5_PYTOL|nr:hypothetical protein Poli38472_008826 [Pythium oligandrum]|eukprot:TMW56178.1 hypothetical protein Poli38472_008826 [Pythium oligandrum]